MTENTNNLNPIHIDNFDKPDVTPSQSNINTNPLDFSSNTAVADLQQLEEIQKQPEEEHNQPEDVQEQREAMLEQREEELGKAEEMHEKVEDVLNQSEEPPQLISTNKTKSKKMTSRRKRSETDTLEQYRVSLTNVEQQQEIAAAMTGFGYDTAAIAEGKLLYENMRKAYDLNKQEDNETLESKINLDAITETVAEDYSLDRKKAKVIFRNDPLVLHKLALSGAAPKAYIKWVECMKTFYNGLAAEPELITKLSKLKFSAEDAESRLANIQKLESARSQYLKEAGESQEATKAKDTAFAEVDKWMSDFYAVAKIAMEDKPQLLESLGLLVRN
ncbi:PQLLE family protein [Labilibaculum euxinus]